MGWVTHLFKIKRNRKLRISELFLGLSLGIGVVMGLSGAVWGAASDSSSANSNANANFDTKTHPQTVSVEGQKEDLGRRLVLSITGGQVNITKEFKAIGNINGYVLTPKAGGAPVIVYADQAGQYFFIGTLASASGENLSKKYNDQYIVSVTAKAALMAAEKQAHWFAEGKATAPHQVYIFIDPNCVYCHLLYQEVYPLIDQGKLQVRWIPVGFLKASSPGKSAALLKAAGNASAAVKLLREDELKFNMHQEEGGIQPLDAKNSQDQRWFNQVSENTKLFNQFGFQGTPTLIYEIKDDQGSSKPAYFPGYLRGKDFENLVNQTQPLWK